MVHTVTVIIINDFALGYKNVSQSHSPRKKHLLHTYINDNDNENSLFSKLWLRMEYSRDIENIYYIHLPHIYNNEQEL